MKPTKPTGKKNYGSIPHFRCSQLGPAEHHITEGQEKIATKMARDRNDLVIVQEKLDGSNVGVAIFENMVFAIQRHGYLCIDSPHKMHRLFQKWVRENRRRFLMALGPGERLCGEWLMQAHGTRYNLPHEPFVAFDLFGSDNKRLCYHDFLLRILPHGFTVPRLIHIGQPFPIKKALEAIKTSGHGAIDQVEGFVYRVERNGAVDFLAKYIRPGQDVGKYLKLEAPVWNVSIVEGK